MKKIFYLSTCSTCQKIMKEIPLEKFELQDIKTQSITESDLTGMVKLAGNYERLFSRRAMKFRSLGLNEKNLEENDYKHWILKEYTFLKRPVVIIDNDIFIGSSKSVLDRLKQVVLKL